MMPISKRFNTLVMMRSPSLSKKLLMPRRDQRNLRLNSKRRSPSETRRSNSWRTRRSSLLSWKRRSKIWMPPRNKETKNGLRKSKNTTKLNTLSKERRKSSSKDWPLDLSSKSPVLRLPQNHSFRFLNISRLPPRRLSSPESHGTQSSSSFPKSLPPLPSKLQAQELKRSSKSVMNFWTRLPNPEKSKEELTNIGSMSTKSPDKDSKTSLTTLTVKSVTSKLKSPPSTRESPLPKTKRLNKIPELNKSKPNTTRRSESVMTKTSSTLKTEKREINPRKSFPKPSVSLTLSSELSESTLTTDFPTLRRLPSDRIIITQDSFELIRVYGLKLI